MNILFDDGALKELYINFQTDDKKYKTLSKDIVKRYVKVVNYLRVATRIEDLFKVKSLNYEKKKGTLKDTEAVWISKKYRLLFKSSQNESGIVVNILLLEISKHYE